MNTIRSSSQDSLKHSYSRKKINIISRTSMDPIKPMQHKQGPGSKHNFLRNI